MELLKLPGVSYCEFPKNSLIITQGQRIDFVYYLVNGTCYRKAVTEKGDEIIYGIKASHSDLVQSLMGMLPLYSDGYSMHNFHAKTKCCCYRIPKEVFLEYVSDKPELLTQLLRLAMKELRNLAGIFQARQEGKVANQLCQLLLANMQKSPQGLVISKGYSNTEIGQFLGVHKVTVARIKRVLKEEGIIDRSDDGIVILAADRLAAYAKGEKNIDY